MSATKKPRVLILGGVGFIGRNLVKYLLDNDYVSYIKVADKSMPAIANLSREHAECFERKEVVKYQQCDLSRPAHAEKAFTDEGGKFDYVVNLCGETRFGLPTQDYVKKGVEPAAACSAVAKQHGVAKWVEVSTAQVYVSSDKPSDEEAKIQPWTEQATFRYEAEEQIRKSGVPSVILRPVYVYGPGDLTGLTPRITTAASYIHLKKTMKLLWNEKLKLNAVHVEDVCAAIWLACTTIPAGKVYNLADTENLDQGRLTEWLGRMFGIKTGFHGTMKSTIAKAALSSVAEMANDDHVPAFSALCQQHQILNTPLSPFLDKELLKDNHLCVDGSRLSRDYPQFVYKHRVSEDELRAQVRYFIDQGIFPPVLQQ